jgi:Uncharacterized protein (competence- and mitomycin-induced)
MAAGIRDTAGTTFGLSTTGIAGPDGGSEEKPVGTVFIGRAYAAEWGSGGSYTSVSRHVLDGDRTEVKAGIARTALELLVADM